VFVNPSFIYSRTVDWNLEKSDIRRSRTPYFWNLHHDSSQELIYSALLLWMMPSEKIVGIAWIALIVALLTVVAVVKGLADSLVGMLTTIGVPAGLAGQFGSFAFFGALFVLIVLALKALQ
jgi:hypothetical protein